MLFFPRAIRAGSTVPTTRLCPPLVLSSSILMLLLLPSANAQCTTDPNNTAVDQCPSTLSSSSQATTQSGLPMTVILAIIASVLFALIIGGLLIYFYLRKRSERKKRDEQRWKVWQFKDMQRTSQQPVTTYGKTFPSSSSAITLVPSRPSALLPFPTQMSEKTEKDPKYPVDVYGAGFFGV